LGGKKNEAKLPLQLGGRQKKKTKTKIAVFREHVPISSQIIIRILKFSTSLFDLEPNLAKVLLCQPTHFTNLGGKKNTIYEINKFQNRKKYLYPRQF
jgi:hypothetical protein